MRTAVNYTIILILMSVFLSSCGRAKAETVLLDSGKEESAKTAPAGDMSPEDAPSETAAPTEAPVIQVVCNCSCAAGGQAGGETAADTAPAAGTAPAEVPGTTAEAEVPDDGKVNINTADAARLQTLNGIGATRAQAIISYREAHGSFGTIEDIKNVSGIKDGIYNQIKDDISV